MPRSRKTDTVDQGIKAKKPPTTRTTTACNTCRTKRAKCDGVHPICTACHVSGIACEYDLGGDKRKPYTKAVVSAMQLRIDNLESELEALRRVATGTATGTHSPVSVGGQAGQAPPFHPEVNIRADEPALVPKYAPLEAFQGGLALNAHGELRYYGPTSSYRAVLADAASSPSTADAIRVSLTRAPLPTAMPAEPALPRRPPELSPDFKARLFRLAFEFCFSIFSFVSEREFYSDLQLLPNERTSHCSPFLMNLVLAVGCRYLDPEEDFPPEICGLLGDPETRGDVFVAWSRYLLDQEWYNPTISTIRGLTVLGIYLAGRGFDGPSFIFVGLSMKLVEDFGLHLGIHRLSAGAGQVDDALVSSRRNTFYAAYAADVLTSSSIGRKLHFLPDEIDQSVPPVAPEIDFDAPAYRSSAFHWSSKLIHIGARIIAGVYAPKPGVSFSQRLAAVPELHLALESWYQQLPSLLRASTSDPSKAPHTHIIALNLLYNSLHIQLHRPFFRRVKKTHATCLSTKKCLVAASTIVKLIKLQTKAHGLRFVTAGFHHAAFSCGTVLTLSASEDGLSPTRELDASRRAQAKADLRLVIEALKSAGKTWTAAKTSANILEALADQWDPPAMAVEAAEIAWHPLPFDSESFSASFPYIFPSWDLDPEGQLDFMSLLNPLPDEEGAMSYDVGAL